MATDEKLEVLQDFGLGLNTLAAPNRLDAKYSPATTNVWVDDGAIAKRPGQLRTSTTNTLFGRSWSGVSLHNSVFSTTENLIIYTAFGVSRNILAYTSNAAAINTMNTGGTGTASTAVASAVVTGLGTNWLTTAAVGALFIIGTTVGQILTVDSDTQLTLTANFGALNSGTTYIITNSWGPSKRVSFIDMNSKVWVCGQGSTTISWNGTTQSFITAFPQAAYSLAYKNYVFAANTAANPSRVAWCSLKDPTTWPSTNFTDVNPDDGFPIVGLVYDGQSIVILKTNSAWKLSGDTFDPASPTYTLTQIYTPSDFVIDSGKSFQLTPGGYIMLGRRGFYSYNGAGAISKILELDRIRGEVANISWSGIGLVPSPNTEPSSIMVDGNYWLQVSNSLSTISAADKELTYVLDKTGAIWKWTALAGGMISDFAYLNGTLYGVNSWSGGTPGLMKLNTGNSDAYSTTQPSTAINGSFTTKVIEFSNSQRFGKAYVYFKKQTAIAPAGTATTTTGSATVTGSSDANFLSCMVAGSLFTCNGVTKTVLAVASNTSMTLTAAFGANNTSTAYTVSGGTNLTFEYSIDEGSFSSNTIDMTSGTGTRIKSDPIMIGQAGRSIQFRVSNNVVAQTFELYAIEFERQELRS